MAYKNITVRLLTKGEDPPFDLLLLADPSEEMIGLYLPYSEVYVAESEDTIIGVCVLYPENDITAEIKNIAVAENQQGKGVGRQLLNEVSRKANEKGFKNLIIGTADSGVMQIHLYQSAGFTIRDIKKGFFTDNYPEPLYENGVLLKDMVILSKTL